MGFKEILEKIVDKTSIANVVAGVSVLYGLHALITLGEIEGVMFVIGGAVGYLYGKKA